MRCARARRYGRESSGGTERRVDAGWFGDNDKMMVYLSVPSVEGRGICGLHEVMNVMFVVVVVSVDLFKRSPSPSYVDVGS